jgi:hypothetical protein
MARTRLRGPRGGAGGGAGGGQARAAEERFERRGGWEKERRGGVKAGGLGAAGWLLAVHQLPFAGGSRHCYRTCCNPEWRM